jgi:Tfp pilus assembly protein PilF
MSKFLKKYPEEMISVILIIGMTLIVYSPVRFFDFIFLDDPLYVCNNKHIRDGLTWDGIIWAIFSTRGGSWHPLTWISHMIDISWYGMDSGGHHWTNVQIHLISTVLLFIFLRKSTQKTWISAAIAAIFAVHPLHVESVAWVSERKDVLSVCLAHLTLLSYLWYTECPTTVRRTSVLLCYCMSLMSKPMMVTLPFLLCILDYWPLQRWQKSMIWALIKEKMPLFIMAFTFAGFALFSQSIEQAVDSDLAFKYRLLNAGIAYIQYLFKIFIPIKLSFFYPHPHSSVSVIWGISCLILTAMLLIFALLFRKKMPFIFTGIIWFVFTLIPVIGIIKIGGHQMADRYTYFPMTGMAIVFFFGIEQKKICALIPVLLTIPIVGCAILSYHQVYAWQNSYNLSTQALTNTSDNNYLAHYGLAEYYLEKDNFSKAIELYKKTLHIAPGYFKAKYQLAYTLKKNKQYDAAIAMYQQYLQLEPLNAKAHNNLASLYGVHTDKVTLAEIHYRIALSLMPESPLILTNYAYFMIIQNKPNAALDYYIQAIIADPSYLRAFANLSQLILTEKEKSDDFLRDCINQICKHKKANTYFTKLSQTFIARKEYQLATFFEKKAHECN